MSVESEVVTAGSLFSVRLSVLVFGGERVDVPEMAGIAAEPVFGEIASPLLAVVVFEFVA
jgi:hypothetical protein